MRNTLFQALGALALVTATVGCSGAASERTEQGSSAQSAAAQEAAREELIAFNDQFNAIAASRDTQAFVDLYVEDAWWIEGGKEPTVGLAGPRETFGFLAANEGTLTHTVDKLVISNDGKLAVMTGTAEILVDAAGLDATGTYQFVMERRDGSWVILSDMFFQHTAT